MAEYFQRKAIWADAQKGATPLGPVRPPKQGEQRVCPWDVSCKGQVLGAPCSSHCECAVRTMKVWLKAPPFSHWCHWCEQRPLLPTTVLMFFHLECSGLLYNLIIQMAQWTRHIYTFSELSSINLFIIHFHRQDIFNILLFGSLFVVVKARLGDLSNFNIGWQTVPQMAFTTMHVRNGHIWLSPSWRRESFLQSLWKVPCRLLGMYAE